MLLKDLSVEFMLFSLRDRDLLVNLLVVMNTDMKGIRRHGVTGRKADRSSSMAFVMTGDLICWKLRRSSMEAVIIFEMGDKSLSLIVNGKTKKECIRNGLQEFNSEMHSGNETLEEYMLFEVEDSTWRIIHEHRFSLRDLYDWRTVYFVSCDKKGKFKKENVINDINALLSKMAKQVEEMAKMKKKSDRKKLYEELKEEFYIEGK